MIAVARTPPSDNRGILEMTALTCDCGELVATCQMSEGYGALTYMICAAVVTVLWHALGSDSYDDGDPPETMYN